MGSETSSEEGIVVSHRPIRPSQDEVRRWVPLELEATEERDDVCRWRDARTVEEGELESNVTCVIWAVRSCDELATV